VAKTPLLQGTLDLLILRALTLGEMHGLGVANRVEQLTRRDFLSRVGLVGGALPVVSGGRLFHYGPVTRPSGSGLTV
jgi:hypothetical protein